MELIKRKIKPKGLKLVVVGAEIIHPSSQRLYKRAFGMEAIEVYGSAEMGTLAYGTQQKNGLKLCDDLTFFEFLDKDDKPVLDMKPARIIVTDLMNKTMPFIRYEQGDLAVANKISIKAPYHERRILKIIGRDDDNLVLPDGSIRPFHDFYEIFDKYLEVKQFRIIQTEIDKITIQISSEPIYFKKNKTLMLEDLKKNFPPGISFSFENVDYLNPDPDGKLRVLISKLK
jgi:phenylacetate-CoA ligase